MPYFEARTTKGAVWKILIDTGANKNYITPDLITKKLRHATKHKIKTISGTKEVNEKTKLNILGNFLPNYPKQTFYLHKFNNFFDGILGMETLKTVGAIFDTAADLLKIGKISIPIKKRYPNLQQLNFAESTHVKVPLKCNQDIFVEHLELSPGVYIPAGIYSAKNNEVFFQVINNNDNPQEIKLNLDALCVEVNNFEEVVPEIKTPKNEVFLNKLRLDHLNQEEKNKIIKLLSKYQNVFFDENSDLSFTNVVKHRIRTKDDVPIYTKNYRYPYCHKQEVNEQINKLLQQNIIRPSISPWTSPMWIVPKKADSDGNKKWRLVVDYRKLNEKTIDDKYPMPSITEILDKLGRCQYFTTLDLASGFHQIEVHPDDIEKTAFSVDGGLYEYLRMPFGLKNAPATFQRVMDHVLRDLSGKCCLVYMDDIIVFSSSLQEHLQSLAKVFEALDRVNLKLQLNKSNFLKKEVAFLGHIVTDKGVKPDPSKIDCIKNWPIPKNPKQLKGFLGLLGYYRKFIRDFAKITKPLTEQLRGEKKTIDHNPQFLKTFDDCKSLLTSSHVLQYPDFDNDFILTTDASNYALGAVLSQGVIGKDRPVAFASRTLSRTEENYSAIEKELLAIDWATRYFRPYLFGRKFILYTDHQPLTYALNLKTPNARLVKWRLRLREFNFEPKYRPGKQNVVADALSRIPEPEETINWHENEGLNTLEETEKSVNSFHNQLILKIGPENTEFEEIFNGIFRRTATRLQFDEVTLIAILRACLDFKRVNCIYCPENLIPILKTVYERYFPRDFRTKLSRKLLIDLKTEEEQDGIVEDTHETSHRGILENKNEIARRFFFPKMKTKIKKYILLCEICNKAKYERKPYKVRLGETPIPKRPLEIVHVDIFISKPCTFLSFVDKFSRFGTLIPIKSRAITHVRKGLSKYFGIFGTPQLMVSDNEPSIRSIEVRGMLQDLNVQQYFTPTNHSQTNGIVERFHSTIAEIFRCNRHKYENLPVKDFFNICCTLYNNAVHSATNFKPREIFYGIKDGSERPLDSDKILETKSKFYQEVIENSKKSQEKQHRWHNLSREIPPTLEEGQKVLNLKQGVKCKTREKFENVEVQRDNDQTYIDTLERKLHKQNLHRIRK